jgi:hypothetical protein
MMAEFQREKIRFAEQVFYCPQLLRASILPRKTQETKTA